MDGHKLYGCNIIVVTPFDDNRAEEISRERFTTIDKGRADLFQSLNYDEENILYHIIISVHNHI